MSTDAYTDRVRHLDTAIEAIEASRTGLDDEAWGHLARAEWHLRLRRRILIEGWDLAALAAELVELIEATRPEVKWPQPEPRRPQPPQISRWEMPEVYWKPPMLARLRPASCYEAPTTGDTLVAECHWAAPRLLMVSWVPVLNQRREWCWEITDRSTGERGWLLVSEGEQPGRSPRLTVSSRPPEGGVLVEGHQSPLALLDRS